MVLHGGGGGPGGEPVGFERFGLRQYSGHHPDSDPNTFGYSDPVPIAFDYSDPIALGYSDPQCDSDSRRIYDSSDYADAFDYPNGDSIAFDHTDRDSDALDHTDRDPDAFDLADAVRV